MEYNFQFCNIDKAKIMHEDETRVMIKFSKPGYAYTKIFTKPEKYNEEEFVRKVARIVDLRSLDGLIRFLPDIV